MRVFITPALLLGFFLLYTAHSGGPQTGKTGAPGEGLCTQCHAPGNPQGLNGTVSISGLPGTITGGSTYAIVVTVTNPNGISQGAGFQMTALDENNLAAGNFFSPSAGSRVHSGGNRQYHDHTSRRAYSGGSASWSVLWTAPSFANDTEVTLYAAGNITDMDPGVNTANDLIVTTNVSGTVLGSGVPLSVDIVSFMGVTCYDGNDGTATAEAMGGAGGYSYAWSNGAAGPTAFDLSAGTYTVTVTDINMNTATDDVQIIQPSGPTVIDVLAQQDASCNGQSDGEIQVSATGNNGGHTYQWSNGQTTAGIFNLSAGTYSVTATDLLGCQESLTLEIEEPDPIESELTTQNANCLDDSSGFAMITTEGGTPPYTFEWSDGYENNGTSTQQNDLAEGSYTVIITDKNGCMSSESFSIGRDAGFELSLADTSLNACYSDSSASIRLVIDGGTPPLEIIWQTGDTTTMISGLSAGTYSVTVTDDLGCIDSLSYDLIDPDSLAIEVTGSLVVDCADDSTDLQVVISGGSWQGQAPDTMLVRAGAGSNIFSAIDSNGCEVTDTVIVTHMDTVDPVVQLLLDTMFVDANGDITTRPQSILAISDNCMISRIIPSPHPTSCADLGDYTMTVEVEDVAGNITRDTFTIVVLDTFPPVIDCIPDTTTNSCSFTYDIPAISDNCDSVDVTVFSGPQPGQIFPTGVTEVIIHVTDGSGNLTECSFEVTVDATLTLEVEIIQEALCFGDTAIYRLSSSGGAGSEYLIIRGDTTPLDSSIVLELSEAITVTLIDETDCFDEMILGPDITPVNIDSSEVRQMSSSGANDGQITIYASGGTGILSYIWFNENGDMIGTGTVLDNLSPGKYRCQIMDDNGCILDSPEYIIDDITSSQDVLEASIKVYPNPFSESLFVRSENSKIESIDIYTFTGLLVERTVVHDHKWQWSGDDAQENGYFMIIQLESGERIIKRLIRS